MANKGSKKATENEGRVRDAMTIDLKLPIAQPRDKAYQSPRIDLELNPRHTLVMRRLLDGLQHRKAKLGNGHFVQCNADVVRYMLERAHEKIHAAESQGKGAGS